jgi:hypothetical protein
MSPAACAGSPPGPRSELPGTAGLLYAVYAADTAWAGVRAGRVPGLGATDLETVLSGVLLKDVGWGACGAVVQPAFGVRAGRRIAGPGPGRPVTVPAQPAAPSWSGTAVHQRPRRTNCRTMHP